MTSISTPSASTSLPKSGSDRPSNCSPAGLPTASPPPVFPTQPRRLRGAQAPEPGVRKHRPLPSGRTKFCPRGTPKRTRGLGSPSRPARSAPRRVAMFDVEFSLADFMAAVPQLRHHSKACLCLSVLPLDAKKVDVTRHPRGDQRSRDPFLAVGLPLARPRKWSFVEWSLWHAPG